NFLLISVHFLVHLFFFFSSRRRHTRFSRDWSSDVCSSDLALSVRDGFAHVQRRPVGGHQRRRATSHHRQAVESHTRRDRVEQGRSEERRVGKECRARWSPRQCLQRTRQGTESRTE